MATTNLISKSLGNILTQSGNGTPNHTAPKGSWYSDQDTGIAYQNRTGSTTWVKLQVAAYGSGFFQTNTTQTTITTINTWVAGGNTLTSGTLNGFTVSGNQLILASGYDGEYEVKLDATIAYVAGTNNYEVGVSKNNANPVAGTFNTQQVNATFTRQHVGVVTTVLLVGGDTLNLAVRNITNTDNVIIRHLQLFVRKVG